MPSDDSAMDWMRVVYVETLVTVVFFSRFTLLVPSLASTRCSLLSVHMVTNDLLSGMKTTGAGLYVCRPVIFFFRVPFSASQMFSSLLP